MPIHKLARALQALSDPYCWSTCLCLRACVGLYPASTAWSVYDWRQNYSTESRRVAIFPAAAAAAARQIFDGDCDAANREKIPWYRRIFDPVGSSINGQKSSPYRQNPA